MLTGDVAPTSGEAFIRGFSVSNQMDWCRRYLGFCPQYDPLLPFLTAQEQLYFYGRLRGLRDPVLSQMVESLLVKLGLKVYADRPCGEYSGGNKRKLSLGIALIGSPALLLLGIATCFT